MSDEPKNTNPHPHRVIEHVTTIDAPIDDVWRHLVDVNDWSWNRWTQLEAGTPAIGLKGTLRACYDGNNKDWVTFPFEFAEVDPDHHVLAWKGSVGPFGGCLFRGYHTMRLEKTTTDNGVHRTSLIHTEVFDGLLPFLRVGLPYAKLDRNYRLMNEGLKEHVEASTKKTTTVTEQ
jgi:hypothetical protein